MNDKPKSLEYARLYLDAPPPGWHAIAPAGDGEPKGQWWVLMVDVPYEELKTCICRTAWLFVHPMEEDRGRGVGARSRQASQREVGMEGIQCDAAR